MDIIKHLDELRARSEQGTQFAMDNFLLSLESAYPTLRQAVLERDRYKAAATELAKAVEGNRCCHVTRQYCRFLEQRDAALKAYRTAIDEKNV